MPAQLRTGDVRWQAAISARVTPGQVPLPATRKAFSAALLSAGGAGLEAGRGWGFRSSPWDQRQRHHGQQQKDIEVGKR